VTAELKREKYIKIYSRRITSVYRLSYWEQLKSIDRRSWKCGLVDCDIILVGISSGHEWHLPTKHDTGLWQETAANSELATFLIDLSLALQRPLLNYIRVITFTLFIIKRDYRALRYGVMLSCIVGHIRHNWHKKEKCDFVILFNVQLYEEKKCMNQSETWHYSH
jgi:hypothetical protein